MSLLPFDALPPHKPRRFVPEQIDLGDWDAIAPLFDQLEARAPQCKSGADLERWLLDWSELSAALDEESSKRYIAMTCHTDNAEAEKAYLHFVENVEPQLKPRQFKLAQILRRPSAARAVAEAALRGLRSRHAGPGRAVPRRKMSPLETEEAKLGQQYQKLSGSLTVQFRGEEKTLVQMGRYLEEPDRAAAPGSLGTGRQPPACRKREKFEEIFDQLVKLREQIARNAGFANYRDYAFRRLGRFDYTPADCVQFHEAVETGDHAGRCASCRPSGGGSSASTRCGPGIWPWTR